MKKILFTFIISTVLVVFAAAAGDKENADETNFNFTPFEEYSSWTDESMSFNFQWKVEGSNLNILMAAATTGWVAIGFDPSKMMADADILIGYVSEDTAYLRDDFGNSAVKHSSDVELGGEENFSDLEGEESDGVTRIRFTIPLDSGDAFDKPLTPGATYKVIYAYGSDDKDDFGSYHAKRGSFEITL